MNEDENQEKERGHDAERRRKQSQKKQDTLKYKQNGERLFPRKELNQHFLAYMLCSKVAAVPSQAQLEESCVTLGSKRILHGAQHVTGSVEVRQATNKKTLRK